MLMQIRKIQKKNKNIIPWELRPIYLRDEIKMPKLMTDLEETEVLTASSWKAYIKQQYPASDYKSTGFVAPKAVWWYNRKTPVKVSELNSRLKR